MKRSGIWKLEGKRPEKRKGMQHTEREKKQAGTAARLRRTDIIVFPLSQTGRRLRIQNNRRALKESLHQSVEIRPGNTC